MNLSFRGILVCAVVTAAFVHLETDVRAVILHTEGEPNMAAWTDRPATSVIGRWGGFGCVAAVSHNCVLTTLHQSYSASVEIRIDGKKYEVERIWEHPSADLRVVKLRGAHLRSFVDIYDARRETGKKVVIAGYGNGRGDPLLNGSRTYGYSWNGQANITLRMGTNRIDRTEDDSVIDPMISDIMIADFDGLGWGMATKYECSPAKYDSGGGWFIEENRVWKLAGLSRGVEIHYEPGHEDDPDYMIFETWFRDRDNPELPAADLVDAVRLSSYVDWIRSVIPEPTPGDLTGDESVGLSDLAVFSDYYGSIDCSSPDYCAGTDSDRDGDVDLLDYVAFAAHWLEEDLGF